MASTTSYPTESIKMNMLISEFSSLSNSKSVCVSMSFKSCTGTVRTFIFTELFKSKMEFPGHYLFDVPPEKLSTGNI